MELIINNFSGRRIKTSRLKGLARLVSGRRSVVSLSFIKKNKIRDLNKRFRGKDRPTDVLSFNMDSGKLLGDVVISPEVAASNARKYHVTLEAEIARLMVHGILHLLGMDHGKKMFDRQDRIIRRAGYA